MNLTLQVIQPQLGNPPIPLTISPGGISIGLDTNVGAVSSLSSMVMNNESIIISVTEPGYHSYSMTIDNVYEADKVIYILMVPIILDINNPDFNRPYAMHYYFSSPCGYKVDFYSSTSFSGNSSWFVNNEFYTTGSKGTITLCNPGPVQIKNRALMTRRCGTTLWDRQWANTDNELFVLPGFEVGIGETGNTVAGIVDSIETYLLLDTESNVIVGEYKPSFWLDISSPVNQLENCCYTRGETVTIEPNIELHRPGALPEDHLYDITVYNPIGELVLHAEFSLTDEDISVSFVPELGTYSVHANLIDTHCDNVYSVESTIEGCDFFVIDYVDCNTYILSNRSSERSLDVNISSIEGEELFQETLGPGDAYTVVFERPSLYFVDTGDIYVLSNYCIIDECISTYILDLLCPTVDRCDPCPPDNELNQMLLLSYTYFMQLNSEYGYNNFYSGLDNTKLAELAQIKTTMDRLLSFCQRRGCIPTTFRTFQTEGPYNWHGQNKIVGCGEPPKVRNYFSTKPGYCKTCK